MNSRCGCCTINSEPIFSVLCVGGFCLFLIVYSVASEECEDLWSTGLGCGLLCEAWACFGDPEEQRFLSPLLVYVLGKRAGGVFEARSLSTGPTAGFFVVVWCGGPGGGVKLLLSMSYFSSSSPEPNLYH